MALSGGTTPTDVKGAISAFFSIEHGGLLNLAREKKVDITGHETFEYVFHALVEHHQELFKSNSHYLLFLYALLVHETFNDSLFRQAAIFISTLNIKTYISSLTAISSRPSWVPRPSEISEFGNSVASESRLTSSHISWERGQINSIVSASTAVVPFRIDNFDGEERTVAAIRQTWLNYFNGQGMAHLSCLIDLYIQYKDIEVEPIAIKYLFLKEVSVYGEMSVISTQTSDGCVVKKANLPKKYFGLSSTWPDLQELVKRFFDHNASNKPIVLVLTSGQQIETIVSFPEENTGFALDIAYAIYGSHEAFANSILAFCGIHQNIISQLQNFSGLPDIHADISLALIALARENPQYFLTKTVDYIQLANIVYNYSLGFFVEGNTNKTNFMANEGYKMNRSAPAYFFITETDDRLIALCFTAVVYDIIGDSEVFSRLRNYLCLVLCSHRSLKVDSICHGVSSFQALNQQQSNMTTVMNSKNKIQTTLSFFGHRDVDAELNIRLTHS